MFIYVFMLYLSIYVCMCVCLCICMYTQDAWGHSLYDSLEFRAFTPALRVKFLPSNIYYSDHFTIIEIDDVTLRHLKFAEPLELSDEQSIAAAASKLLEYLDAEVLELSDEQPIEATAPKLLG